MPSKTSAVDRARDALNEQIAKLDDDRARLERALAELNGSSPGRGRPRGKGASRSSGRTKGARGAAPRRDQALRLIKANPGIRPSELARKMGVAAPYIYRVVPPLIDDGKVKKDGKGYVAAG